MRSNHMKTSAFLVVAGALALLAPSGAHGQSENDNPANGNAAAHRLEGSWRITVQSYDCKTGAKIGPPFLSLATMARGGTQTETTSNPMFYPAQRSPGHGVWSYEGRDDYRASSIAIITVNGMITATQVIRQQIEMENNPDKFASVAKVQFFKPDGTLLRAGCASAIGTRFE